MIDAVVINCKAFVFNVEDVDKLRREHRIIGSLIGCLPRAPRQHKQRGLPLQLMPEEATMLNNNGVLRLVKYDRLNGEPINDEVKRFEEWRRESCTQQVILRGQERKRKLIELAPKIEEGKKNKKLRNSVKSNCSDNPEIKTELCEELEDVQKESTIVQLCVECPWIDRRYAKPAEWNFPNSESENIRLKVYSDLWGKKYFLTAGGKFGGDFLVYPGDPAQYHATYIAICIQKGEKMSGLDVVAKGRVGTAVKKKVLLCSLNEDGSVKYLTLQWSGF